MKSKILGLFIALAVPVAFYFYFSNKEVPPIPRLKRYLALTPEEADTMPHIKHNDTLWHILPPFEFLGHNGKTITQKTFEDKIFVADFFFTNCPGICPKMSGQLARVQNEYRYDEEIMLLSHTVDPQRDTLQALAAYAELYGALPNKWLFVTGDKKALYHQARKGYYITATEGDGGEEDFVHSEKLVLVDKDKVIRGYYDGTDTLSVNRLMFDIKLLKLEYPQKSTEPELRRKR